MRRAYAGLIRWMSLILIIVIAAMASFWLMDRLDFASVDEDEPAISEESVIYSELRNQVTQEQIESYLSNHAGTALRDSSETFFTRGERYDIDPAFAVAVSRKETSLGKQTCAGIPPECNNFFCINETDSDENDICYPWAHYGSPEEAIDAFYRLIKYEYVTNGQDTISEIGCHPDSGFRSHCYCLGESTAHCPDWVSGDYSVPVFTEEIRTYRA